MSKARGRPLTCPLPLSFKRKYSAIPLFRNVTFLLRCLLLPYRFRWEMFSPYPTGVQFYLCAGVCALLIKCSNELLIVDLSRAINRPLTAQASSVLASGCLPKG